MGHHQKASLNRGGGVGTWLEPLVFSRRNTSLGTPALVNEDRHQLESKPVVPFTVLHVRYCFHPRGDRLWGGNGLSWIACVLRAHPPWK